MDVCEWATSIDEFQALVENCYAGSFDDQHPYPTESQLRFELCVAHHLFAERNMTDTVWNHLSVRETQSSEDFFITPFPMLFDDMTPADMNSSSSVNKTGIVIHSAVYNSRRDVCAIVHLHTPAVVAVSCLQDEVMLLSQDAAGFYGKIAYHDWQGMSDDFNEQEIIARDFGTTAHTLIMRNHGALTVGRTIGEAWIRMLKLEEICRLQLEVLQTQLPLTVPSNAVLQHTADQFNELPNPHGYSEWPALVRRWAKRLIRSSHHACCHGKHDLVHSHSNQVNNLSVPMDVAQASYARRTRQIPLLTHSLVNWRAEVSCVPYTVASSPALVPCRRAYLVGSAAGPSLPQIPTHIRSVGADFPLAYEASTVVGRTREELSALLKSCIDDMLPKCGALLFKHLNDQGVTTAEDFSALMKDIGYPALSYAGTYYGVAFFSFIIVHVMTRSALLGAWNRRYFL